jgi:hypothetical protein
MVRRNLFDPVDSEHLEAYLAGELDETGRHQVERALRHDADLRASFVNQARLDAALKLLLGHGGAFGEKSAFEQGVMARLRSEGAGDRGFAKSVLLEIVEERERKRPLRWPDLVKTGLISAAASIGLLLLFQSIIFREGSGPGDSPKAYVARIERSDKLVWDVASAGKIGDGGWLSPGLLRIESGSALIAFNSGATALVEGPAELSIETGNRMYLNAGRLAADVPPPATGFTVNTPRLNAIDLGTRFGVVVDGEGNSELHVMEGEVKVSRTSGNAVATLLREGSAVRADNRTRSELMPVTYGGDQFRLVVGKPVEVRPALSYRFDESTGAILEDGGMDRIDIPMVASGELDRSPRRAAGHSGGGLVFQPGETLDVPLSSDFRLEEAHSLALWIKLPAKIGRTEGERIVEYGRGEPAWKVSCNLDPDQGIRGALRLECGGGALVGSTDLADGNWHHVAYRFLGGDAEALPTRVHLFVDGRQETLSHVSPPTRPVGRAGNLRLGGDGLHGFAGWIDDFHFFREAISTSAIQELGESMLASEL